MRNHLVTTLHCAECGNEMEMPLEHERKEGLRAKEAHYISRGNRPSGCDAYMNQLFILPCKVCKRKSEAPVKAMAEALKGLAEFQKEDSK